MTSNMKTELTSKEYWALPEAMQNMYQQTSLVYNGFEWVERTVYGYQNVRIKTIYRLKTESKANFFGGLGIGTF